MLPPDTSITAAQNALLALRASVSREAPLRDALIRIPGSPDRLTPEVVVKALAAAPKPLACSAREAGGRLEVHYAPLRSDTWDGEWHAAIVAMAEANGGFLGFLARSNVESMAAPQVLCIGRAEELLVSVAACEKWYVDYYIPGVNIVGDGVDNPLAAESSDYRSARHRGAAAIVWLTAVADETGRAIIIERDSGGSAA